MGLLFFSKLTQKPVWENSFVISVQNRLQTLISNRMIGDFSNMKNFSINSCNKPPIFLTIL
ncbi:hypothetical protein B0E43_10890 [Algoriphagus sp. A40]|nr:hypothetical protein B0E43_10890 [Algoriphagus sp. A40]